MKSNKTNFLETPAMKSTQTAVNSERTADLEQMIISHEDENIYEMVQIEKMRELIVKAKRLQIR